MTARPSPARLDRWQAGLATNIALPAIAGLVILCLAVLGFGAWAATAKLSSAAVADGVFIATGQNKTIQHLEGGIVREILVKEGDLVKAGQPLVLLDETAQRSDMRRLRLQLYTHLAISARLEAELQTFAAIRFPQEVMDNAGDPEVAAIMEAQGREFAARQHELDSEIRISRDRIEAIRQEIKGLRAQQSSLCKQLELLVEEVKTNEDLLEKGLVKRPRYLALKRSEAALEGDIGKIEADIGRAAERITEAESQIALARSQHKEKASAAQRESQTLLDDIRERIKSTQDILSRRRITAPVRGVVVKLHHNTPGGVIAAGQDIIELLPADDQLLIEARVSPSDIDVVRTGLGAEVRLVALDRRTTPLVQGSVTYVSADAIEDERRNAVYYLARIQLDDAALAQAADLKISPGMPVEVYIRTGERTFFDYLLKPITDSFNRAFRES